VYLLGKAFGGGSIYGCDVRNFIGRNINAGICGAEIAANKGKNKISFTDNPRIHEEPREK